MKLPHIDPVRVIKRDKPFDDPDWIFEAKYDGFRGLLYSDHGKVRIVSKGGVSSPFRSFRKLEKALTDCGLRRRVILDGEVCSVDENGRPNQSDLRKGLGRIAYVAFDIMWLDDDDLRAMSLDQRKEILQEFAKRSVKKKADRHMIISTYIRGQGASLYDRVLKNNLEGIVAKKLTSLYTYHTRWYKIKNPKYSPQQ